MRHISLSIILLIASACSPCDALFEASKRFEESVGAQYIDYVKADKTLSDTQKQDKLLNVSIHRRALKKFGEQR